MPPWEKYAAPSPAAQSGPWSKYAPLAQPKTFERDEDEALYREALAKETERRSKPRVPVSGVQEPVTAEEAAIQAVQQQRGREGEQKEFDASRTPVKRALDASTFALSAPIRMATRGEYGLGDVAGLVSDDAKRVYNQSEADFARANETGLGVVKAIGDVSAGIPALSTMGAPLRGLAATGTALASRPLPASAVPRALVRNKRLEQIQDFEGAGVKVFAPALEESGVAGTVKQLSDAPVVGAPVRNRLGQAIEETRDAGERIAGEYGDARTFRDVGNVVRARLDEALAETGTAGERVASEYGGARTYRDVGNVVETGLDRLRDSRAADIGEDAAARLSDDALAAASRAPARQASIRTKQDALYERAWRGIPPDMQQGRSRRGQDRFLGGMTRTREFLQDISARNQRMYSETRNGDPVDARLSYPIRGGVAGQIVEDIIDGRWRGNLQSMREVRSNFRRLASGISDTEKNTLQLSDMRRLQSTMTQDMIGLLERNADHYATTGNAETASRVRRAIHDFRRADQFTRASAGRLDALEKLYGAQSSEQLALGIVKDAMGGSKGGNLARLSALRRSLRNEEWGDVSSGIIRELGRPTASSGQAAAQSAGFSPQTFASRWREMSPEGKNSLFGGSFGSALRRGLDRFAQASGRMVEFEAMANKLYGTQSAEGLALGILKDAMGGRKGGNLGRLTRLRGLLDDQQWGDVSSGVIRELGRPVGSARGAAEEAGFSVNSFMTNWRNMSEEGKNVLFNRPGESGKALRNSLDRFVRVADRMANFEAMANTSRSATNALGMAGLASVFTAAQQAITGNFQTAAAAGSVAAGTYAFGRFMTSPLYVRWLTRAAELSGDPGKLRALRAEARKLAHLAEKEPDPAVQSLMGAVAAKIGDATREEFQER
jgi:hypothetical protein